MHTMKKETIKKEVNKKENNDIMHARTHALVTPVRGPFGVVGPGSMCGLQLMALVKEIYFTTLEFGHV